MITTVSVHSSDLPFGVFARLSCPYAFIPRNAIAIESHQRFYLFYFQLVWSLCWLLGRKTQPTRQPILFVLECFGISVTVTGCPCDWDGWQGFLRLPFSEYFFFVLDYRESKEDRFLAPTDSWIRIRVICVSLNPKAFVAVGKVWSSLK